MRILYTFCFISIFFMTACREAKTNNDEGIDIKQYENNIDQYEELSEKEQELRQRELELQRREEELMREKNSIHKPDVIEEEQTRSYEQKPPRPLSIGGIQGEYPEASKQLLTANDLRYISKETLFMMRNEIFARHGYIFKSESLNNHFSRKPWYNPQHEDVSHLLTHIEKENIRLIKAFENL